MIVPRCKIDAGKVIIDAGSFFFGPGCIMNVDELIDLTVGHGVNHGSMTAGQNNAGPPTYASYIRPTQKSETNALTNPFSTLLPEYSTASFSTNSSLRNQSSISAESHALILVAIFLNFLINRF